MRKTTISSERRQAIRRWGVAIDDSSSEVGSMITDSAGSIMSGRSAMYGSETSSTTTLTSYLGSDHFDLSKAGQERTPSPEQNSPSLQDPQAWETDTDYWVGGRGEADDETSGPSWAGESPRPSRWDSSFNQYISTTGQPISPSQGRLVQPPRVFFFFHVCIKTANLVP